MSKSKVSNTIKGIKVRTLSGILSAIMCVLCITIFCFLISIRQAYSKIILTLDDYVECEKAITDFTKASDFLTTQSRFFIVNHDPIYLKNYFSEYENLKNRETAIEVVEMTHSGDQVDVIFARALGESNFLAEKEIYAMKLVCVACDLDIQNSVVLENINLTKEDLLLTEEKKLEKAKNLLFNSDYLYTKASIESNVNEVISLLINNILEENNSQNVIIRILFIHQTIFIILLLVFSVIMYMVLQHLVLRPLIKSVESIEKGVKMCVKGAFELNYIAKAYNNLCEKNILTASILKHKAEHDPLTGLINREAFSQIKNALKDIPEPIAYLIVDIDLFKKINDEFGHQIGDDVLRKISNLLMEQFRTTDYVARIGGDEFAIIMTKFGDNPTKIIQRKIEGMNNYLQSVTDGLPNVSLSVGVAFSECGYKDWLMEQSDHALYTVKRGGRCNCSFFRKI